MREHGWLRVVVVGLVSCRGLALVSIPVTGSGVVAWTLWGVLSPAGSCCRRTGLVVSGGCWWGLSVWLSLENCTVDASISRCIAWGLGVVVFGW